MENFLTANGFDTLHILHNNACTVGNVALCGTRGWPFDDVAAQGEKLMAREAGRLRMSLQAAGDAAEKIAFLHYPPIYPGAQAQELVDVLNEFGVTECYYGHLHGQVHPLRNAGRARRHHLSADLRRRSVVLPV